LKFLALPLAPIVEKSKNSALFKVFDFIYFFFKEPRGCVYEMHIRDSKGDYSKSACLVGQRLNHNQASKRCERYGMQLFRATSQHQLNAVTEHADLYYWLGPFWKDGEDGKNCLSLSGTRLEYYHETSGLCNKVQRFYCEYKCKLV
jgi:hypothetical protein